MRAPETQTRIVSDQFRRAHPAVRKRGLVVLSGILIAALLVVVQRFVGWGAKASETEPKVLSADPIAASFGFGEGVRFVHSQGKEFEFRLDAPLACVVWVHFQSKGVLPGQIAVTANGAKAGFVPADGLRSAELAHELLIGADLLRLGELNRIAFINQGVAHGKKEWRIWNVWAEAEPLPQMSSEQLRAEAEIAFRRAKLRFEQREIGAPNRFLAWKDFRNARLLLEAHPKPRPELYDLSSKGMSDAQRELDSVCAKLLLEMQRAISQRKRGAAHAILEQLSEYFPASRSSCALWAERRRLELGL